MMKKLFFYLYFFLFPAISYSQSSIPQKNKYFLIAHRGGIIDSTSVENSQPALESAIRKRYYMVEVDLRLTKDSILIIQHDPTFKRYYGVDSPVSSMTWDEISKLRSSKGGSIVLKFEEVLKVCEGRIQLLIDNKIKGILYPVIAKLG